MSRGYCLGFGKFRIEGVDSIGYGYSNNIFSGDTVFNQAIPLSYEEIAQGLGRA